MLEISPICFVSNAFCFTWCCEVSLGCVRVAFAAAFAVLLFVVLLLLLLLPVVATVLAAACAAFTDVWALVAGVFDVAAACIPVGELLLLLFLMLRCCYWGVFRSPTVETPICARFWPSKMFVLLFLLFLFFFFSVVCAAFESVCAAFAAVFHVCAAAVADVGASCAAFADLVGASFLFCCCLLLFVLVFVQLASACAAFVVCAFCCFCCIAFSVLCAASASLCCCFLLFMLLVSVAFAASFWVTVRWKTHLCPKMFVLLLLLFFCHFLLLLDAGFSCCVLFFLFVLLSLLPLVRVFSGRRPWKHQSVPAFDLPKCFCFSCCLCCCYLLLLLLAVCCFSYCFLRRPPLKNPPFDLRNQEHIFCIPKNIFYAKRRFLCRVKTSFSLVTILLLFKIKLSFHKKRHIPWSMRMAQHFVEATSVQPRWLWLEAWLWFRVWLGAWSLWVWPGVLGSPWGLGWGLGPEDFHLGWGLGPESCETLVTFGPVALALAPVFGLQALKCTWRNTNSLRSGPECPCLTCTEKR